MQINVGEEPANKRQRADSENKLAELYRKMASICGYQIQLMGDGMYLANYKRFVKFATTEEKTWIRNALQPYENKNGVEQESKVELANQFKTWYEAIWQANMLRDIASDEGVTLLLIEPIQNPLVSGDEYSWVGFFTDYVANKSLYHRTDAIFHRCGGFAPYIIELAVKNRLTYPFNLYDSHAIMPNYCQVLGYMARQSPIYTRFRCHHNNLTLGTIVKAMAYHLYPTSTKYMLSTKEQQDLIGFSFLGSQNLLQVLASNNIIPSAQHIIPFPVTISLTGEKKQDIRFFAPALQKPTEKQEFNRDFLAEVMRLC